jgi:hypothetical protein
MPPHKWFLRALAVAAVALLACGGCSFTKSSTQPSSPAPAVLISGDPSDPVNRIVISAITDLQKFWADQFPKLYGHDYTPVKGRLRRV